AQGFNRGYVFAPKGLEDSAQGFNLGNPQNKMVCPEAERRECNSDVRQLDPVSASIERPIWRPFRARRFWVVGSQG
ncbi:MAG: hypothetical protein QOG92_410, partial [Verrucomicrobiota bacterium]|nr:hypothetical protein [Verrucomicrobiota bacterium]